MDLSEFLLARIAEDEEVAQAEWDWMIKRHGPDFWTPGEGTVGQYEVDRDASLHVSPRRILAECKAKRRIVEGIRDATVGPVYEYYIGPMMTTDTILSLLALPFTNHPDYDEAWRP